MMWMVDIRDFRHVTVAIAYFLYLLLLSFRPSFSCSYYPIFAMEETVAFLSTVRVRSQAR
jgi:hypothetical protein